MAVSMRLRFHVLTHNHTEDGGCHRNNTVTVHYSSTRTLPEGEKDDRLNGKKFEHRVVF